MATDTKKSEGKELKRAEDNKGENPCSRSGLRIGGGGLVSEQYATESHAPEV